MSNSTFDSISEISLTDDFIKDIKSTDDLELFWVSFVGPNSEFPEISDLEEYTKSSGIAVYNYYTLYQIKTDRFEEDHYLIDFSSSGINGFTQSDFQLDRFTRWRFYYRNASKNNLIKIAFELSISIDEDSVNNLYALSYTRNIILLNLEKYKPTFNFIQVYKYQDSDVAVPLYQHYHKTNDQYSESAEVMDGRLVRSKLSDYRGDKPSFVNYGEKTSLDAYLDINKVNIPNKLNSKIVIPTKNPSILDIRTNNGLFLYDSNLFAAFDNTEYFEFNSEYDKYPLLTLYGVDSIADLDELNFDWSLLIYELEE